MNLEEFFEKYKPIAKPGACFLTYEKKEYGLPHQGLIGKDVDIRHIWTVVEDGESDKIYIVPGIAVVNKLGFVVTEVRYDGNYADEDTIVY